VTRYVLRYARETTLEAKVVADAWEHHRIKSIKLKLNHDSGWPDRMLLVPGGRPFFIEFKRKGEIVNVGSKQEFNIALLLTLGYDVEVHDDYDTAMRSIWLRTK
jgi:hypothetical protein